MHQERIELLSAVLEALKSERNMLFRLKDWQRIRERELDWRIKETKARLSYLTSGS